MARPTLVTIVLRYGEHMKIFGNLSYKPQPNLVATFRRACSDSCECPFGRGYMKFLVSRPSRLGLIQVQTQ